MAPGAVYEPDPILPIVSPRYDTWGFDPTCTVWTPWRAHHKRWLCFHVHGKRQVFPVGGPADPPGAGLEPRDLARSALVIHPSHKNLRPLRVTRCCVSDPRAIR